MYLEWVCFHVEHKIVFKFWYIFPFYEQLLILEPFTKKAVVGLKLYVDQWLRI